MFRINFLILFCLFRIDLVDSFASFQTEDELRDAVDIYLAGKPSLNIESRRFLQETNSEVSNQAVPTSTPSVNPTKFPTMNPSVETTKSPTVDPTVRPTISPTQSQHPSSSMKPTSKPTPQPTSSPSSTPSKSVPPTLSIIPSKKPTSQPSSPPTKRPTSSPTKSPTKQPTSSPSSSPTTSEPSSAPSSTPTEKHPYDILLDLYGPIEEWDVTKISRFENLFSASRNPLAVHFNADIGQWNTANAEFMHDMFLRAEKFDADLGSWDVKNVRFFNGMFNGATSFQGKGLENWDVGSGELFMVMFLDCDSLDLGDISGWKVSNAVKMQSMFKNSNYGNSPSAHNLCAWREKIDESVIVGGMFQGTNCADTSDPTATLDATSFCQVCPTSAPTVTPGPTTSPSEVPTNFPTITGSPTTVKERKKPNVLLIATDQQKYDAFRRVQDMMQDYNGTIKLRTPNLDKLSKQGAWFKNAYCQMAVCAPARSVLRTGCTIERTGIQYNDMIEEREYTKYESYRHKIESAETLDHILVEKHGYVSEYYGKWHMPNIWYNFKNQSGLTVTYNNYDYEKKQSEFRITTDLRKIKRNLNYFEEIGLISRELREGEQIDTFTGFPYKPIVSLDSRHGYPTGTPLTMGAGFSEGQITQDNVLGNYSLSANYTPSRFNGEMPIKALDRLLKIDQPWFMTVNFHNPHSPMVPAWEFLEYYWNNRDKLFVSPSINDERDNTPYRGGKDKDHERGLNNVTKIQEWTAVYYALVEEVDFWVGQIIDKLGDAFEDTLIIFTTDHGEHLGSHGRGGKNTFYEEASRAPLFMVYPERIPAGIEINTLVSHLDIFATILDYAEVQEDDHSDGKSLRPLIENRAFNELFDENVTVTEWGSAALLSATSKPTLMVRKGAYKMMMHKLATSNKIDMLINLDDDPYEVNNLIGEKGSTATDSVIRKAEHLRCLLIEWMERMDGEGKYFSDPMYNSGEGEGDIAEIRKRATWKEIGFWFSEDHIEFGSAVWNTNEGGGSGYIRNEYLYLGTRQSETIGATLTLEGDQAEHFSIDATDVTLTTNICQRIKVSFQPTSELMYLSNLLLRTFDLKAHLRIQRDDGEPDELILLSATTPNDFASL